MNYRLHMRTQPYVVADLQMISHCDLVDIDWDAARDRLVDKYGSAWVGSWAQKGAQTDEPVTLYESLVIYETELEPSVDEGNTAIVE